MSEAPELGEPTPEVVAVVTDIAALLAPSVAACEPLGAYTRRAFGDWLRGEPAAAAELRAAVGATDTESLVDAAYAWIDEKRQEPALEAALGAFWADAYANSALANALAEDAVAALSDWHQDRRAVFVFASRPRVAQRALLRHSDHGDVSELFAGFFDTRVGPPDDVDAFIAIARALGDLPAQILYISTSRACLDAAAAAGWQTCQLVREDADPPAEEPRDRPHPAVATFAAIELL